jgi:hypothetical protein
MNHLRSHLIHRIIAEFAPRHVRRPRILHPGRKSDRKSLAEWNVAPWAAVAMPDVVIHDLEHDWLFLIDASARQRHMTETRLAELMAHFASSGIHLIFFSAFTDHRNFCRCVESIAWETHVWIADAPDHMIHFNGGRFFGPYPEDPSIKR